VCVCVGGGGGINFNEVVDAGVYVAGLAVSPENKLFTSYGASFGQLKRTLETYSMLWVRSAIIYIVSLRTQ
jgi:hypothetical protein